ESLIGMLVANTNIVPGRMMNLKKYCSDKLSDKLSDKSEEILQEKDEKHTFATKWLLK
ncbi:hypothetical protein LOAG_15594, partial [Loa loa]